MQSKKVIHTFFLSSFLMALIFFLLLYLYDPLKLYHKPFNEKYANRFHSNMREQAAGVIRNWDFDSIILGTSVLENSSANEASRKLGGKFVNLSLEGGNYFERQFVLSHVLKKKKIAKVIYSLDHLGVVSREGHPTFPLEKWTYLYDDNPFNDPQIYLNNKYMKCLLSFSSSEKCLGKETDLDMPNAWFRDQEHAVRFGGLDRWFQASNNFQIKEVFKIISDTIRKIKEGTIVNFRNNDERIEQSKRYLDETILSEVLHYSDTEFILVLPPYSRIFFAIEAQYDKPMFRVFKESIRYLVTMSGQYPNLKLYGWGDHDFPDDIANYKDLFHYSEKINSWMLDAIEHKEGLLTSGNVEKYLERISEKGENYDLFELGEKIDNYLSSSEKTIKSE